MAKRKGNTALTKITSEARRLKKKHPNTPWTSLIKKAGAAYRAGSLGATKLLERGETKSTKVKKTYRVNRSAKGRFKGMTRIAGGSKAVANGVGSISRINGTMTIAGLKSQLKQKLETQLGAAYIQLNNAKRKMMKRKIQKRISAIKSQIRKIV